MPHTLRTALLFFVLEAGAGPALAANDGIELISVRRADVPQLSGNRVSSTPAISADARFVAFTSAATDLIANDTNLFEDIFIYDRHTQEVTRLSMSSSGAEGDGASFHTAISADGRFVAFTSLATNLVANDTNGGEDIFVHDRRSATTTRVSISSDGSEARFSPSPGLPRVSQWPSISADGRYVAFASNAYNLADPAAPIPPDDQIYTEVFVHDRHSGTTTRVSVNAQGVRADAGSFRTAISADGRIVAFESNASNLSALPDLPDSLDIFVRDRQSGTTSRVSFGDGSAGFPALSGTGRLVAFSARARTLDRIFVHDRVTGLTSEESLDSSGRPANGASLMPSLSALGRFVVFQSSATNLVPNDTNRTDRAEFDVFIRDRELGQTKRVSLGTPFKQLTGDSRSPVISAGGQYVAFDSSAANAVVGDANDTIDVFLRDRAASTTTLLSTTALNSRTGIGLSDTGGARTVSSSGRYVAFSSRASTLVPGDTNEREDVFVRDRAGARTELISVSSTGAQANGASRQPALTRDGRYVAFASGALNLVAGKTQNRIDIFLRDRITRTTTPVSLASNGAEANGDSDSPAISNDGRYVAFNSSATNLVPNDTNGFVDVFVRDRQLGTTTRVSVGPNGVQADASSVMAPSISADGRYVAFTSVATNLDPRATDNGIRVYVHDRQTGKTTLESINPSVGDSGLQPAISENGVYIAYQARQLFVRDRSASRTIALETASGPITGSNVSISADGRYIAFDSDMPIFADDINLANDVFVYDRWTRRTVAITPGTPAPVDSTLRSGTPSISPDGSTVAFASALRDLVAGDFNEAPDVFVRARPAQ